MRDINKLISAVNDNDLLPVLCAEFGDCLKVSIPFSQKACDTDIDEIDFSVRAMNALKRVGVFTVGEVIDLIASDGLLHIRNLGKKTQNEIKTRILVFGYERLTENEKKRFFYDVVNKNSK